MYVSLLPLFPKFFPPQNPTYKKIIISKNENIANEKFVLAGKIDYSSHRRRNPRFHGARRENERFVRQYESEVTRDHEQNAPDGGEDGGRVEGVVGFFRGGDFLVLVCLVVLKEKREGEEEEGGRRGDSGCSEKVFVWGGGYVIKGCGAGEMGNELGRVGAGCVGTCTLHDSLERFFFLSCDAPYDDFVIMRHVEKKGSRPFTRRARR